MTLQAKNRRTHAFMRYLASTNPKRYTSFRQLRATLAIYEMLIILRG
jgi:hypothetical protein